MFKRTGPLDEFILIQPSNNKQQSIKKDTHDEIIPKEHHILHIFTDGACTNNGKRSASAAWGVLIVSENHTIIDQDSGKIPSSETQTNQRAELTALLRGLQIADNYITVKSINEVNIWSDSQYAIKCASEWGPTWRKNGWVKRGGDIQHLDLVKVIVGLWGKLFQNIHLKWVEGHKGGNAQYQFPWIFNHRVDQIATDALSLA